MGKIAEQIRIILACNAGESYQTKALAIERIFLDRKPKKWNRNKENEPKWDAEDWGHNQALKEWQDNLKKDIE